MTPTATMPTRSAQAWASRLDATALSALLGKMRQWGTFDGDAPLEDICDALDDVPPRKDNLAVLAQRLHEHLIQLADIAAASPASHKGSSDNPLAGQHAIPRTGTAGRRQAGRRAPAPHGLDRQRAPRSTGRGKRLNEAT